MASYDVLKEVVGNGSNLVLFSGVSYDLIRELAATAQRTGAKLTVTTGISYDLLREPSAAYESTITFIDGLDSYKNECPARRLQRPNIAFELNCIVTPST